MKQPIGTLKTDVAGAPATRRAFANRGDGETPSRTPDRRPRAAAALTVCLAVCLTVCLAGSAGALPGQSRTAVPSRPPLKLGVFFWHDSPNDEAAFTGVRTALKEVGREHEFLVERIAEDRAAGARALAAMRRQKVDLVFAMGTQAALLAAEHIRDIPVVFTAVTHPVESGVVPSWRGSTRNLAGNSNWIAPETVLRTFRLTVPDLRQLGVLRTREGVVSAAELRSLRRHIAATGTRVRILEAVVEDTERVGEAVDALAAKGVDAIWIPIDRPIYENTRKVFEAACRHGIPVVSSSLRGTRTGATSGVVVDYGMLGKRAAAIALEIIYRGKAPGSIPIGTMRGYRVVVNLAAARRARYEVPLSLLVLADVLLERLDGDDKTRGK